MKVSFINPEPNETLLEGEKTMIAACPPLGILYLASTLQNEGIEVSVLDQAAEYISVKKVADWVIKEDPDILGLSALISNSLTAPRIAEEVKKRNPDIIVVLGNHHATFNAERILKKYPYIDVIVRGEGEQTCLELVNCLKEKRGLKDVLGVTFRHNNRIVSNPDRPLIRNIDLLPFPQRGFLDIEYHNTTVGINVAPKKFTSFLSSRGCVFKCRFCSCASIAQNLWRSRSVENVMEELHLLASEGYKQIMFVDDNFTLNRKRTVKLCHRMRKERIDMEWICEGRVDQSSYDMFREMVKAGCRMMYFGIESGTQKVLDYYDKKATPEQSKEAVEKARKAGMDLIVGSFIIGAPNETKADIQKTLNFASGLDLDIPQINILGAFPGNSIWEELKEKGLIDEDKHWERGIGISDIYPYAVPLKEMREMVREFYQNYLWSPKYIMRQMLLTLKSQYRLNVVFNSLSRISTVIDNVSTFTSL
jgi:anaerobic magnesium-protoporphyrin IX monomethyl ester cyclase